jgi:hypothetical protein
LNPADSETSVKSNTVMSRLCVTAERKSQMEHSMNAQLWHDWTKTAEKNRFYKAKTKIWQKYVSRFRNTNAHIQACQKW